MLPLQSACTNATANNMKNKTKTNSLKSFFQRLFSQNKHPTPPSSVSDGVFITRDPNYKRTEVRSVPVFFISIEETISDEDVNKQLGNSKCFLIGSESIEQPKNTPKTAFSLMAIGKKIPPEEAQGKNLREEHGNMINILMSMDINVIGRSQSNPNIFIAEISEKQLEVFFNAKKLLAQQTENNQLAIPEPIASPLDPKYNVPQIIEQFIEWFGADGSKLKKYFWRAVLHFFNKYHWGIDNKRISLLKMCELVNSFMKYELQGKDPLCESVLRNDAKQNALDEYINFEHLLESTFLGEKEIIDYKSNGHIRSYKYKNEENWTLNNQSIVRTEI